MGQITTNAIVLRRVDYRENDRMLTLFSPTLGRIDALCRGCRRQKSPADGGKRTVLHGGICALSGCGRGRRSCPARLRNSYYPLRVDYERLSHGMYALELCSAAVQPAQENERLFLLLLKSLAYLCYDTVAPRRVTAVFLMGMTSLLGFRPQVGRCAQCGKPIVLDGLADDDHAAYFGEEAGGVLCKDCGVGGRVRLTAGEVRYLQAIMRCGLGIASETRTVRMTCFERFGDGADRWA